MSYINQRIMQIISKEFRISKTDINTNTNLIVEYNLCGWELELLYLKIEKAFNIQIDIPVPHDELSVMQLANTVLIVRTRFNRKRHSF